MEADSDEGEDDTLNDQSEEAELTKVQQDRMFNEHFNQTGTESYKDNYYRDLYNQKPEDIAKRYEGSEEILDDTEYAYDEEEQQRFTILPSLRDPKLFRVRCRIGQEREACICQMNKFLIERNTDKAVGIFSASALDKFSGCIFVEAHREFHVKEAIKGIKILNMNQVDIIGVKEVTQVFTPDPKRNLDIEVGQFVRVKRGLYDGDLGMIKDFDDDFKKIEIKIVPRLFAGSTFDDDAEDTTPGAKRKSYFEKMREMKQKNIRPPQKYFSTEEFPDATVDESQPRHVKAFKYKSKHYHDGMQVQKFPTSNLQLENVVPTFEEITMFQKAEPNKEMREDLMDRAKATINESKKFLKNLEKGDRVKIISGDLKGLTGIVMELSDNGVKVMPAVDLISEPIDFMPSEIVKVFEIGDHVEILAGKHKGLTGSVIKVDDNICHIISEDFKEEMQVLVSDVKYTTNVVVKQTGEIDKKAGMKGSTHEFTKHDLVIQNDNKTVGVITSVLRDTVTIYDTEGFSSTYNKIQILNKLNPRGRTKNSYGQEIYPRCTVRVSDGIHKGKLALVKHVYNNFQFLFNESQQENAGIFVEHINNCYFIGADMYDNTAKLARFNNPVLSKINEEQMITQISQNFGTDESAKTKNAIEKKQRQDPKSKKINLIGQVKTVVRGPWKGYEGTIVSLNNTSARFMLSAKPRTLTLKLEDLNIEASEREGFSSSMQTAKTQIHKPASSPFCIHTPAYNPE